MGRLADRRVVHVQIAADGAHDDLARVEPDPDLHVHAVRVARLLRIAHHQLLHPERRITRPDGVVLVGERRAEQRHDPVAHDLVHRALVAMDRVHHVLEHRIEELARVLGIAVGQQFHRALQVREQHGDLLALTFQGGLGGEDLLGQMLRGVALRAGRLGRRDRPERRGALAAELVLGWVPGATGGTGRDKRGGALPTELHAGGILVLAAGALHAGTSASCSDRYAGTWRESRRARRPCQSQRGPATRGQIPKRARAAGDRHRQGIVASWRRPWASISSTSPTPRRVPRGFALALLPPDGRGL